MKYSKSRLFAAALGVALFAGLTQAPAADNDDPKAKQKAPPGKRGQAGDPSSRSGGRPGSRPGAPSSTDPKQPTRSNADQKPSVTPDSSNKTPPAKDPLANKPPAPGESIAKQPVPPSSPGTQGTAPAIPGTAHTTPSTPTIPGTHPTPSTSGTAPTTPAIPGTAGSPRSVTPSAPVAPRPAFVTHPTANGGYTKVDSAGNVRERKEQKPDGVHVTQTSVTGKNATETVKRPDGTEHVKNYAADGKTVRQEVIKKPDGSKEITTRQSGIGGNARAQETVHVDSAGKEVSKTVVVKQTTVLARNTTIVNNNTTIINNNNTRIVNNTQIVRNYDRGHYGYVYRPVYVVNSPVFVSWYDPYWYPGGVLVVHPFRYSWGWDDYGWYRYHRHYFHTYEVYPAPAYWVTDWLIAGYVADRYAASMDAAAAREEARLAREEAARALQVSQQARDQAEIAEAYRARDEAEARAAKAEARAVRVEAEDAKAKALAGQPHPNATPIDEQTKETLKSQIEKEMASKKEIAEQTAKGAKPVIPDLSQALADPKHIYPVSKAINVISAKDQNPAGTLTEGDLLKLEPGQEGNLKNSTENTFVTMRVMTSKGEDGEVVAGTLVSISLKDLQDFDSEFRAKLDLGLAEAEKNKDAFKVAAK